MLDSKYASAACEERNKLSYMKNLRLYGPSLSMRFNCLKAIEALRGDSLLSTTQFPGVTGTHLINAGRMTSESPSGFELGTAGLGIQRPNHYNNWEDLC